VCSAIHGDFSNAGPTMVTNAGRSARFSSRRLVIGVLLLMFGSRRTCRDTNDRAPSWFPGPHGSLQDPRGQCDVLDPAELRRIMADSVAAGDEKHGGGQVRSEDRSVVECAADSQRDVWKAGSRRDVAKTSAKRAIHGNGRLAFGQVQIVGDGAALGDFGD